MKERPILMSAPMVRATLRDENPKTQTRRVVKPQPVDYPAMKPESRGGRKWVFMAHSDKPGYAFATSDVNCPYGQPGDRLWVRETWSADPHIDDSWASTEWNGCGRKVREIPDRFHHPRFCNYAADWLHEQIRWTPSIHMPRWASRILLEITAVRVERLQDISKADARAEGLDWVGDGYTPYGVKGIAASWSRDPRESYRVLWESINGPGSWSVNPWVWVLEFRRL